MFCFLETDIRVQKSKILGDILFKIPKNLILGFFFAKAETKKNRYASVKTSNAALVKLTDY